MKTLLERATPELKQAMDENRKLYPNLTESLERALSKIHLVSEIQFDFILELKSVLRANKLACQDHELWNYFTRE